MGYGSTYMHTHTTYLHTYIHTYIHVHFTFLRRISYTLDSLRRPSPMSRTTRNTRLPSDLHTSNCQWGQLSSLHHPHTNTTQLVYKSIYPLFPRLLTHALLKHNASHNDGLQVMDALLCAQYV